MKSLDTNHTSYESLHPELYLPEREVYLDGVLQSTRYGNEPYHEALVHPSMFAHPNPKRVGIIGGGEGATLREALKHKSIEVVTMIEIDEEMVSFSRKHLPDWNTCSDIEGSAEWCGDDPRARIFYEDGVAWFHDRFSDEANSTLDGLKEEPFDVLIMDALDPQDNVVSTCQAFLEARLRNYADCFLSILYSHLPTSCTQTRGLFKHYTMH